MKFVVLMVMGVSVLSCTWQSRKKERLVARVGKTYLYEGELEQVTATAASREDSLALADSYIRQWALDALLLERAGMNLPEEKTAEYDKLIDKYKTELYTRGYKDLIVSERLDRQVSEGELQIAYDANKDSFILREELIQIRYIHTRATEDDESIEELSRALTRFEEEDVAMLQEQAYGFISHSTADSIWVKPADVAAKFPALSDRERGDLLKKSNFTRRQDSLEVFLIYTADVLSTGDIAPKDYVRPTLEQIILNQRKLDILTKLEKEIVEDAIKTDHFEVIK